MSRRLFDRNPEMGITRWFHHDDATGESTIHTEQDIEPLLELNSKLRNNQTRLDRWGDGKIVASVPMTIYGEWLTSGKIHDQSFLTRWLNDPANRVHRTFIGKV